MGCIGTLGAIQRPDASRSAGRGAALPVWEVLTVAAGVSPATDTVAGRLLSPSYIAVQSRTGLASPIRANYQKEKEKKAQICQ